MRVTWLRSTSDQFRLHLHETMPQNIVHVMYVYKYCNNSLAGESDDSVDCNNIL